MTGVRFLLDTDWVIDHQDRRRFPRDRARRSGIRDGRSGSVTAIQRFGGGLNLNVHFHTLVFDGVFFSEGGTGALDFHPLPPPTDEEVGVVLASAR